MKYVSSLPSISAPQQRRGTRALSGVEPARERILPPQEVERPHRQPESVPDEVREKERRYAGTIDTERRKCVRRIRQDPILFELRSGKDRRHGTQREDDRPIHIDIKV
ncbi:MAG: hypothetical protein HY306_04420 [Nitrosomonadales bacterium]|nr:hypothetical protein [Nitrosomonadales bacterium]